MTRRIVMLTGGIASLLLVVASPVAHMDHHLLTAHMAQHLILMLVAAPLILLGARPATLPQPPVAICWFAGSFTVIFWHIPAIFERALESHFWHGFEQASFVIAGILFWRPVIDNSGWSAPIYLFLAALPCDALSAFLAFCGNVVYRPYLSGHAGMFGLSPLDDQALAGALMWVAVTFAYLMPALVLTGRLFRADRATRLRLEFHETRG
jgi:cytochrome c oxidase assembly factor CtaG